MAVGIFEAASRAKLGPERATGIAPGMSSRVMPHTVWPFSEMILANALPHAPAPSTETFMAAPPVDARSRPDPVSPDQIGIHRAAWSRSGVRCRAGAAGYSNDAYRWRAQPWRW